MKRGSGRVGAARSGATYGRRAYERSPEAVRAWLQETYPAIAERARAEDAEIHWGDETALVNTDVRGRSFAPRGKARWMIIDGAINHEKLIEFFEALVADAGRKVFLILDNRGASITAGRSRRGWPSTPPGWKCSICPAKAPN